MAKNRYVSISFSQGIKQQVPPTLLPLPLLTQASNLVIKDTGRLESRADFRELSGLKLPAEAGRPLKLFTYKGALFAVTDKNILLWEASTNSWRDFVTRFRGLSGGRFRNMGITAHPITQKESDIQNLAFARFGDSFVFFYTYRSILAPQKTFYYKVWNVSERRVTSGGERQFSIEEIGDNPITGIFALQNNENPKELWVGASWADNVTIFKFNPLLTSFTDKYTPDPAIPNIRRFILHKDRIFYTTDGTTVQSEVFNPSATDKAVANEITSIPDPSATALDFSNTRLFDFQNWVDFSYDPPAGASETFRAVWSVQTGFYILNANNRIVGHLYGNFTPYNRADPPRMIYLGGSAQVADKVYFPILRSGQPEVVNRGAITDRIVPQGQQLAVFRPLGLELLELDFTDIAPPQAEQIDQQMLISGPLLSWTDGQSISEYSFTEKPQIIKTDNVDYDRWPYSDLDVTLPSVAELARNQYSEITLPFEKKVSPFLVEPVTFTAGGAWKAESTTAKRTMRLGTNTATGLPALNKGVFNSVTYDSGETALVFEWTGWSSDDEYPRLGFLNGIRYNFHSWDLTAGTLKAYHYTDENPLITGEDYEVKLPEATSLVSTDTTRDIQPANEDNRNTNIKIEQVRLTRSKEVSVRLNPVGGETSTATARLDFLNQQMHKGALVSEAVRSGVGVGPNDPDDAGVARDTSLDVTFSVGDGFVDFAFAIGNDVFVSANRIIAKYTYTGGRLVSASGPSNFYSSQITNPEVAFSIKNTVWINEAMRTTPESMDIFRAYDYDASANSFTYNSSKNLNVPHASDQNHAVVIGTTLWYRGITYEYSGSSFTRGASSKDLPATQPDFQHKNTVWSRNQAWTYRNNVWTRDTGKDVPARTFPLFDPFFSVGDVSFYVGESRVEGDDPVTIGLRGFSEDAVTVSLGTLSNTSIGGNISLAGLWTTGTDSGSSSGDFYMLFSGTNANFATGQALDTAVLAFLNDWTYKEGENIYKLTVPAMFADKTFYTIGSNRYVRYKIPDWATSQQLRDIILDSASLDIDFVSEDMTSYVEAKAEVQPDFLSGFFQGFDENNTAKELNASDVRNTLIFYKSTDRNLRNSINLSDDTFQRIGSDNSYYFASVSNPLPLTPGVFDFQEDMLSLILRYPLVEVQPDVSIEESLSARVYNYKCQFKWQDENGLEHRSQFSDIIQLITNTPIGQVGNQPAFEIKHLNLTNKGFVTIAIEIYRTKDKGRTFQFLKAIPNEPSTEQTIVTDDVEDSGLGAPAGPDNVLLSGAKFVTAYKGRFVLYGFPDKPNRVVVSSPRQPFSNNAIAFKQANLPGDLIELLMEQDVINVRAMDNYLLIFCKSKAFVWSINEGSVAQQNPSPVTGLANLTADSFNSSVETTEGVLFNTSGGKGIHLVTRGLQWRFEGEPVKKAWRTGKAQDICLKRDTDDIVFIKDINPDMPDEPRVFVYNQRYKQWTSWVGSDLVSCTIWGDRLTALNNRGEVFQEREGIPPVQKVYEIQTGWIAFDRAFISFQRLREITLLAEFEGLQALVFRFDYNYKEGFLAEEVQVDLSQISDSPAIAMGQVQGGPQLSDQRLFRIQPRTQQCNSVRVNIKATAKTAKFDGLRLGIDSGPGIRGQANVVSGRA